jgi:hypothetical protein
MRTLALLALYEVQRLTLDEKSLWDPVIVLASIQGFFTNLYTDLTIFALAMATFFFAWAALLWMTSGNNERNRTHAQGALYAALGGLALALLAQTISGLVNTAAQGQ